MLCYQTQMCEVLKEVYECQGKMNLTPVIAKGTWDTVVVNIG